MNETTIKIKLAADGNNYTMEIVEADAKQGNRLDQKVAQTILKMDENLRKPETAQMLANPQMVMQNFMRRMMGGFVGNLHSAEFAVSDKELAYVNPAKIMAMTVIDLLFDGAKGADAVKESFAPRLTKEEYINC